MSKRSSKARRREPVRHPIPPARLHAPQQRNHGRATLTPEQLVDGWNHAPDLRIRLAQPNDIPHLTRLSALAGVDLAQEVSEGIEQGIAAAALIAGLRDGKDGFTRHMAQQFFDHQTARQHVPFVHATLPLVAEHSANGVVGSLVAYPPVGVVSQFLRQLPDGRRRLEAMLSGGTAIARVKALGVDDDHRRAGTGSALLRCCRQVYERCDYFIVYGQMPQTPGLDVFYRKNGFKVLDPGAGFDAWVVFGTHTLVHAPEDERIFIWTR